MPRFAQIYKNPCTQCGRCCRGEVCIIGQAFLGTCKTPCSALVNDDGKYLCGLITDTSRFMIPSLELTEEQCDTVKCYLVECFSFGVGCDADGELRIGEHKGTLCQD